MSAQPIIKICGVKTPDMLDHVIATGADMVGFVHFAPSPRHLPLSEIAALVEAALGRIETVVLLVDPDAALIKAAAATGVDWLQFHGHETPALLTEAKALTGKKIIKALPVGAADDLKALADYEEVADRFILDAKPPKDATRPGGLGVAFDWDLLKALDPSRPFMLSGGLNIETVAQAVRDVKPFGLDVSSGVERDKGVKDAGLIAEFVARARAAARP